MHCRCYLYLIFKYTILECAEGFREENYSATRVTREMVVDSLMSRCRCSIQVLAATWLQDGHTWRCIARLWCVGPTWGTLRMRHWGVIAVTRMPTWRKCSTNSFNKFRRARWDGWVVVTECKYKSGRTIEAWFIKPQREILKTTENRVYRKNGV